MARTLRNAVGSDLNRKHSPAAAGRLSRLFNVPKAEGKNADPLNTTRSSVGWREQPRGVAVRSGGKQSFKLG
jgi:hypothetical protein